MCGIAGFVDFKAQSSEVLLRKMTERLHHRGPDDGGIFFTERNGVQIGLGHRRLSILDLSSHGHQPMAFEGVQIVYNGEVYNFKEIREDLEREGYRFDSASDTEVILKSYHRWGLDALKRFNGMFAIAIFDSGKNRCYLIRDRSGIKPLYWYQKEGTLLFASELKSFHIWPGFDKRIDLDAVGLFLQYQYIPEPRSIFRYVKKLRAGHYCEIDLKNEKVYEHRYWDVIDHYNRPTLDLSESEAMKETERLLKSAFEYRMVSDVPVGIFLSGGYDSSIVTALLQQDRTE
ncbi:MAG: asparagine synthase (glutamine-hydrolyzing), partial [Campylobacteraceae bacterium 4484_4]